MINKFINKINRKKDMKLDEFKIELKRLNRFCICGFTNEDKNQFDPEGIGFDEFETIDLILSEFKKKYTKEVKSLNINLSLIEEMYNERKKQKQR